MYICKGGGRVELEVGYEKFKTKGVKKGEGEEEGIYLLAKDLAYNVALDQTSQLTEGIKQLTKKNMHDVSNAINILDPSMTIDGKICKTGTGNNNEHSDDTKCATSNHVGSSGTDNVGLNSLTSTKNQATKFNSDTAKLGDIPKTSAKISTDISALHRDQKGVVSSAFAKAHEGAEIPTVTIISILMRIVTLILLRLLIPRFVRKAMVVGVP